MQNKSMDHLGNEYPSDRARAQAYGLNDPAVKRRIKTGWSLERALTTPLFSPEVYRRVKPKRCKDHLGNEYPSESARAKAYGLNDPAVKVRLRYGWSLEKALTTPLHPPVYDGMGNEFASISDMISFYGITKVVYSNRKKAGWPLERILTTPICRNTWVDLNGNEYSSYKKLCKANGISESKFIRKYKAGCTLEECMDDSISMSSGECRISQYLREKGIEFKYNCSIASIWNNCFDPSLRHLRIDFILWVGKEILAVEFDGRQHFERNYMNSKLDEIALRDSKKTEFLRENRIPFLRIRYTQMESIAVILNDFVKNSDQYLEKHNPMLSDSEYYMIRDEIGVIDCSNMASEQKCIDHKGIAYPTITAMCRAYGKSRQAVMWRVKAGSTLEEALETPVEQTYYDDSGNVYHSISDICRKTKMGRVTAKRVVSGEIGWDEAKIKQDNTDHKGRTYKSFKDMCKQYNKSEQSVKRRLSQGYDIEYALTCPRGPIKEKYEMKGKHYANLNEVAKAIGISSYTLNQRRKEGMTLDEIFETKGKSNKIKAPKIKYYLDGKGYSSYAEIAKAYNLSYYKLLKYLKMGLSLQEAVVYTPAPKPRPPQKPKSYEVDGVIYHSISEVARAFNIPANRLSKYMKLYSIEEAIKRVKEETTIFTNEEGKTFRTYQEIADYYGISVTVLYNRCRMMTILEALNYRKKNCVTDHCGKLFNSKKEMAEYWGITPKALEGRLSLGWDLQRALTTPMKTYVEDHEGRRFMTTKEMCEFYKKDPKVVRHRLSKNWSLKDALTKPTDYRCQDIYGNEFSSSKEMCKFHQIDYSSYRKLLKNNIPEHEAFLKLINSRDKRRGGEPV
ncbi:MAG: hypothetical protein IKH92_09360 [Clostridiales bacterium]|nr:hypothetical protein [Clostridiales bacterium]